MSNINNNTESSHSITDEVKDQNNKYNLSKFDYELFKEEDNIAEKVIRIKRVPLPNKGERWKIMENTKVIFIIEGAKLSKKEKTYLRSVDGFNFMLAQAKTGIKSFNALRNEIKKRLK